MNKIDYCLNYEKVSVSNKHDDILYKAGSKDGCALSGSNFMYYDKGKNSYIYKFLSESDVLLKVYKYDYNVRFRLSKSMFEYLKGSNLPCVVPLYDYFYLTSSLIFQLLGGIDAYSMKEVTGESMRFIDYDKKQLIEIMKCLEKTLTVLSKKKIILCDMHPKNVILTDNGVTIIDCDQFMPSSSSESICYSSNKENVLNCIKRIIDSEIGYDFSDSFVDESNSTLYDSFKGYICNFDENTIGEHLENQKCKKKC